MRVLVATIFVSSLLVVAPSAALDDPVPPVGHHVLENGTFVITEPIVIGPGSSLTIRNATVWLDFPTTCSPVGGTLGYCQPQILATGGRVRIVRSTIDTHLYDPAETLSMYAISVIQGNLQVEHSTLRHARIVGGQGDGGGLSYVGDSVIEDGFQGLSFIRGMQARVEDSTFRNLTYGVSMRDAEGAIVDNVFRFISGNGGFGRAIDVENTIVGEKAYDTLVTVEGNLVEDSHQALLNLNGFPNIIRDNVFRRNVSGTTIGLSVGDTQLHTSPPIYEDNVLQDNQTGLQIYASGAPREATTYKVVARSNSFLSSGCNDVEVLPTAATVVVQVDAASNWWGRPEGPVNRGDDCPGTVGNVTTQPWLQEPPG